MLFFIAVANVLSDREEVGMVETVLIGGIGSVRDGVFFVRDVGGARRLTGRLSHSLGSGMVPAIDVVAEAGVLESVFSFGGMDVGLGRSIETDGLSFDNFGISRWSGEQAVGGVVLWSSQDTTF